MRSTILGLGLDVHVHLYHLAGRATLSGGPANWLSGSLFLKAGAQPRLEIAGWGKPVRRLK